MRYYTSVNRYLQQRFGCKVYKVALSGGFTCPNRDGTLGSRGCIFCSQGGSGDFAGDPAQSITQQLCRGKAALAGKIKNGKYIAYFQSYTGTYAPVERLRALYTEALADPQVVALSIATRPDCLPPQVLDLLAELNRQKPVFVELGLQTIHRDSAAYIRRGYPLSVFDQAMANLTAIGVNKVVHIILGLPGESRDQMAESVRYAVGHGADGLKLQLLHVLRGTDLAADYAAGKCPVLTLPEYLDTLDACLQQVPKEVVIHRLTGDGPKRDLIAPLWSADKKAVLNAIRARFAPYPLQDGTSSIIIHDSAAEIKG